MLTIDAIYNANCLELMQQIDDKSIDMIFCDLPYGQTSRNKWDVIIPFDKLWLSYERIIKDNGIIILFANGMFTADLMNSNRALWRYNLIWQKTAPTGFLNANKMPLRSHEDICIFYKKLPTYNPQKITDNKRKVSTIKQHKTALITDDYREYNYTDYDSTERFPTSVLTFAKDTQKCAIHSTQKPLELCKYLIRTYSNEEDIILDNCCGSGTIPLAAKLENRHYIGIDNGVCENKNSQYNGWYWADVSIDRIDKILI